MNRNQYLGAAMIVVLFGGIFVAMAVDYGLRFALGVFGSVAGLLAWVEVAGWLLGKDRKG